MRNLAPVAMLVFSVFPAPAFAGWQRTELLFGLSIPDGTPVSESDWQSFVDREVIPRFPDGFTVVDARGAWRQHDNTVAREDSRELIIVHATGKSADADLEAIRAAYVTAFRQESVLRIDDRVKVDF